MLLERDLGDAVKAAIAGFSFVVSLISSTYATFRVSTPCIDIIFTDHSIS